MRTKKRGVIALEVVMLAISALYMYPFYYMVINTMKTSQDAAFNPLSLPARFVFDSYARVFADTPILNAFKNSLVITVCAVGLIVLLGSMAAYAISFGRNKSNTFFMFYLLAGFMIPMQSSLIPLFEIMTKLHLIDKLSGIILFYSQGCVFAFFLYLGFMRSFPSELEEAAIIDGCGPFQVFTKVVFPLLKPITTTVIIYHTMWTWNDFLFANEFLNSRSNSTLILEIFRAKGQFSTEWSTFMAMLVIVLAPSLVFFLFMQKHIIKGLMGGAIKG
ncbi:carbohydrate ABC transporter permease [Paenibacillus hodogayensis]|uniref:Carbohydrate ABC transporter permease n=1 Tax=Paenibacillus hodogayensis TaxID=279208 RepID=A0ABV5W7I4_9BACL